jgi:hypothetical protein
MGSLVVLGGIASLLIGFTAAVGMHVGRNRGELESLQVGELVHLAIAATWGILALSPVLGFRGGEFLDVTRLFVLPVSHRTAVVASVVGSTRAGAVLFWVLPLMGLVVGLGGGPVAVTLRLLLMGTLVLHSVAVGQLLVLLLLDFLRSRRFRELGLVAAPLAAGAVYLISWLILSRSKELVAGQGVRALLDLDLSRWIAFLPSKWVSEAVIAVETGEWNRGLPYLLGFLPLTFGVIRLAALLQERSFLGDVPAARPGGERRTSLLPGSSLLARWFPDEVLAVASKEWRLLRREPLVRSMLLGQGVFLLMPVLFLALRQDGGASAVTAGRFTWLLPFMLVFVESTLTLNLLGLEGPGYQHLATTPITWRRLMGGKNLCYLLGFGSLNIVVCAVALAAVALLRPDILPTPFSALTQAAVGGTAALMVLLAVGNVVSLYIPVSLTVRGRMALRQQGGLAEGCYEKLARAAVFAGAGLLAAPIPLLMHVLPNFSEFFQEPWWTTLGGILSLAYGALLLRASLSLAEEIGRDRAVILHERLAHGGE